MCFLLRPTPLLPSSKGSEEAEGVDGRCSVHRTFGYYRWYLKDNILSGLSDAAMQTTQIPGRARNDRSLTYHSLSGLALWALPAACCSQPHLHLHVPPCVCSHHGISAPWPRWTPHTAFGCWWTTSFLLLQGDKDLALYLGGEGDLAERPIYPLQGPQGPSGVPEATCSLPHLSGTLLPSHTACSTALTQLSFRGVRPMTPLIPKTADSPEMDWLRIL